MQDTSLTFTLQSSAYADPEADKTLEAPLGHEGPLPPGLAWVEGLAAALGTRGWEVPHRWVIPAGHGLEAQGDGRRFDVTLRCVDRKEGRWELGVEVRRGLLPWPRKGGGESLARLGADLREILGADAAVESSS